MLRKLGFLVIVTTMTLPAWSEPGKISAGTISGYVRDGSGVPQMGAAVEILGSAAQPESLHRRSRFLFGRQSAARNL